MTSVTALLYKALFLFFVVATASTYAATITHTHYLDNIAGTLTISFSIDQDLAADDTMTIAGMASLDSLTCTIGADAATVTADASNLIIVLTASITSGGGPYSLSCTNYKLSYAKSGSPGLNGITFVAASGFNPVSESFNYPKVIVPNSSPVSATSTLSNRIVSDATSKTFTFSFPSIENYSVLIGDKIVITNLKVVTLASLVSATCTLASSSATFSLAVENVSDLAITFTGLGSGDFGAETFSCTGTITNSADLVNTDAVATLTRASTTVNVFNIPAPKLFAVLPPNGAVISWNTAVLNTVGQATATMTFPIIPSFDDSTIPNSDSILAVNVPGIKEAGTACVITTNGVNTPSASEISYTQSGDFVQVSIKVATNGQPVWAPASAVVVLTCSNIRTPQKLASKILTFTTDLNILNVVVSNGVTHTAPTTVITPFDFTGSFVAGDFYPTYYGEIQIQGVFPTGWTSFGSSTVKITLPSAGVTWATESNEKAYVKSGAVFAAHNKDYTLTTNVIQVAFDTQSFANSGDGKFYIIFPKLQASAALVSQSTLIEIVDNGDVVASSTTTFSTSTKGTISAGTTTPASVSLGVQYDTFSFSFTLPKTYNVVNAATFTTDLSNKVVQKAQLSIGAGIVKSAASCTTFSTVTGGSGTYEPSTETAISSTFTVTCAKFAFPRVTGGDFALKLTIQQAGKSAQTGLAYSSIIDIAEGTITPNPGVMPSIAAGPIAWAFNPSLANAASEVTFGPFIVPFQLLAGDVITITNSKIVASGNAALCTLTGLTTADFTIAYSSPSFTLTAKAGVTHVTDVSATLVCANTITKVGSVGGPAEPSVADGLVYTGTDLSNVKASISYPLISASFTAVSVAHSVGKYGSKGKLTFTATLADRSIVQSTYFEFKLGAAWKDTLQSEVTSCFFGVTSTTPTSVLVDGTGVLIKFKNDQTFPVTAGTPFTFGCDNIVAPASSVVNADSGVNPAFYFNFYDTDGSTKISEATNIAVPTIFGPATLSSPTFVLTASTINADTVLTITASGSTGYGVLPNTAKLSFDVGVASLGTGAACTVQASDTSTLAPIAGVTCSVASGNVIVSLAGTAGTADFAYFEIVVPVKLTGRLYGPRTNIVTSILVPSAGTATVSFGTINTGSLALITGTPTAASNPSVNIGNNVKNSISTVTVTVALPTGMVILNTDTLAFDIQGKNAGSMGCTIKGTTAGADVTLTEVAVITQPTAEKALATFTASKDWDTSITGLVASCTQVTILSFDSFVTVSPAPTYAFKHVGGGYTQADFAYIFTSIDTTVSPTPTMVLTNPTAGVDTVLTITGSNTNYGIIDHVSYLLDFDVGVDSLSTPLVCTLKAGTASGSEVDITGVTCNVEKDSKVQVLFTGVAFGTPVVDMKYFVITIGVKTLVRNAKASTTVSGSVSRNNYASVLTSVGSFSGGSFAAISAFTPAFTTKSISYTTATKYTVTPVTAEVDGLPTGFVIKTGDVVTFTLPGTIDVGATTSCSLSSVGTSGAVLNPTITPVQTNNILVTVSYTIGSNLLADITGLKLSCSAGFRTLQIYDGVQNYLFTLTDGSSFSYLTSTILDRTALSNAIPTPTFVLNTPKANTAGAVLTIDMKTASNYGVFDNTYKLSFGLDFETVATSCSVKAHATSFASVASVSGVSCSKVGATIEVAFSGIGGATTVDMTFFSIEITVKTYPRATNGLTNVVTTQQQGSTTIGTINTGVFAAIDTADDVFTTKSIVFTNNRRSSVDIATVTATPFTAGLVVKVGDVVSFAFPGVKETGSSPTTCSLDGTTATVAVTLGAPTSIDEASSVITVSYTVAGSDWDSSITGLKLTCENVKTLDFSQSLSDVFTFSVKTPSTPVITHATVSLSHIALMPQVSTVISPIAHTFGLANAEGDLVIEGTLATFDAITGHTAGATKPSIHITLPGTGSTSWSFGTSPTCKYSLSPTTYSTPVTPVMTSSTIISFDLVEIIAIKSGSNYQIVCSYVKADKAIDDSVSVDFVDHKGDKFTTGASRVVITAVPSITSSLSPTSIGYGKIGSVTFQITNWGGIATLYNAPATGFVDTFILTFPANTVFIVGQSTCSLTAGSTAQTAAATVDVNGNVVTFVMSTASWTTTAVNVGIVCDKIYFPQKSGASASTFLVQRKGKHVSDVSYPDTVIGNSNSVSWTGTAPAMSPNTYAVALSPNNYRGLPSTITIADVKVPMYLIAGDTVQVTVPRINPSVDPLTLCKFSTGPVGTPVDIPTNTAVATVVNGANANEKVFTLTVQSNQYYDIQSFNFVCDNIPLQDALFDPLDASTVGIVVNAGGYSNLKADITGMQIVTQPLTATTVVHELGLSSSYGDLIVKATASRAFVVDNVVQFALGATWTFEGTVTASTCKVNGVDSPAATITQDTALHFAVPIVSTIPLSTGSASVTIVCSNVKVPIIANAANPTVTIQLVQGTDVLASSSNTVAPPTLIDHADIPSPAVTFVLGTAKSLQVGTSLTIAGSNFNSTAYDHHRLAFVLPNIVSMDVNACGLKANPSGGSLSSITTSITFDAATSHRLEVSITAAGVTNLSEFEIVCTNVNTNPRATVAHDISTFLEVKNSNPTAVWFVAQTQSTGATFPALTAGDWSLAGTTTTSYVPTTRYSSSTIDIVLANLPFAPIVGDKLTVVFPAGGKSATSACSIVGYSTPASFTLNDVTNSGVIIQGKVDIEFTDATAPGKDFTIQCTAWNTPDYVKTLANIPKVTATITTASPALDHGSASFDVKEVFIQHSLVATTLEHATSLAGTAGDLIFSITAPAAMTIKSGSTVAVSFGAVSFAASTGKCTIDSAANVDYTLATTGSTVLSFTTNIALTSGTKYTVVCTNINTGSVTFSTSSVIGVQVFDANGDIGVGSATFSVAVVADAAIPLAVSTTNAFLSTKGDITFATSSVTTVTKLRKNFHGVTDVLTVSFPTGFILNYHAPTTVPTCTVQINGAAVAFTPSYSTLSALSLVFTPDAEYASAVTSVLITCVNIFQPRQTFIANNFGLSFAVVVSGNVAPYPVRLHHDFSLGASSKPTYGATKSLSSSLELAYDSVDTIIRNSNHGFSINGIVLPFYIKDTDVISFAVDTFESLVDTSCTISLNNVAASVISDNTQSQISFVIPADTIIEPTTFNFVCTTGKLFDKLFATTTVGFEIDFTAENLTNSGSGSGPAVKAHEIVVSSIVPEVPVTSAWGELVLSVNRPVTLPNFVQGWILSFPLPAGWSIQQVGEEAVESVCTITDTDATATQSTATFSIALPAFTEAPASIEIVCTRVKVAAAVPGSAVTVPITIKTSDGADTYAETRGTPASVATLQAHNTNPALTSTWQLSSTISYTTTTITATITNVPVSTIYALYTLVGINIDTFSANVGASSVCTLKSGEVTATLAAPADKVAVIQNSVFEVQVNEDLPVIANTIVLSCTNARSPRYIRPTATPIAQVYIKSVNNEKVQFATYTKSGISFPLTTRFWTAAATADYSPNIRGSSKASITINIPTLPIAAIAGDKLSIDIPMASIDYNSVPTVCTWEYKLDEGDATTWAAIGGDVAPSIDDEINGSPNLIRVGIAITPATIAINVPMKIVCNNLVLPLSRDYTTSMSMSQSDNTSLSFSLTTFTYDAWAKYQLTITDIVFGTPVFESVTSFKVSAKTNGGIVAGWNFNVDLDNSFGFALNPTKCKINNGVESAQSNKVSAVFPAIDAGTVFTLTCLDIKLPSATNNAVQYATFSLTNLDDVIARKADVALPTLQKLASFTVSSVALASNVAGSLTTATFTLDSLLLPYATNAFNGKQVLEISTSVVSVTSASVCKINTVAATFVANSVPAQSPETNTRIRLVLSDTILSSNAPVTVECTNVQVARFATDKTNNGFGASLVTEYTGAAASPYVNKYATAGVFATPIVVAQTFTVGTAPHITFAPAYQGELSAVTLSISGLPININGFRANDNFIVFIAHGKSAPSQCVAVGSSELVYNSSLTQVTASGLQLAFTLPSTVTVAAPSTIQCSGIQLKDKPFAEYTVSAQIKNGNDNALLATTTLTVAAVTAPVITLASLAMDTTKPLGTDGYISFTVTASVALPSGSYIRFAVPSGWIVNSSTSCTIDAANAAVSPALDILPTKGIYVQLPSNVAVNTAIQFKCNNIGYPQIAPVAPLPFFTVSLARATTKFVFASATIDVPTTFAAPSATDFGSAVRTLAVANPTAKATTTFTVTVGPIGVGTETFADGNTFIVGIPEMIVASVTDAKLQVTGDDSTQVSGVVTRPSNAGGIILFTITNGNTNAIADTASLTFTFTGTFSNYGFPAQQGLTIGFNSLVTTYGQTPAINPAPLPANIFAAPVFGDNHAGVPSTTFTILSNKVVDAPSIPDRGIIQFTLPSNTRFARADNYIACNQQIASTIETVNAVTPVHSTTAVASADGVFLKSILVYTNGAVDLANEQIAIVCDNITVASVSSGVQNIQIDVSENDGLFIGSTTAVFAGVSASTFGTVKQVSINRGAGFADTVITVKVESTLFLEVGDIISVQVHPGIAAYPNATPVCSLAQSPNDTHNYFTSVGVAANINQITLTVGAPLSPINIGGASGYQFSCTGLFASYAVNVANAYKLSIQSSTNVVRGATAALSMDAVDTNQVPYIESQQIVYTMSTTAVGASGVQSSLSWTGLNVGLLAGDQIDIVTDVAYDYTQSSCKLYVNQAEVAIASTTGGFTAGHIVFTVQSDIALSTTAPVNIACANIAIRRARLATSSGQITIRFGTTNTRGASNFNLVRLVPNVMGGIIATMVTEYTTTMSPAGTLKAQVSPLTNPVPNNGYVFVQLPEDYTAVALNCAIEGQTVVASVFGDSAIRIQVAEGWANNLSSVRIKVTCTGVRIAASPHGLLTNLKMATADNNGDILDMAEHVSINPIYSEGDVRHALLVSQTIVFSRSTLLSSFELDYYLLSNYAKKVTIDGVKFFLISQTTSQALNVQSANNNNKEAVVGTAATSHNTIVIGARLGNNASPIDYLALLESILNVQSSIANEAAKSMFSTVVSVSAPTFAQLNGSCFDGIKSGTESDLDCGGECPQCANMKACNTNSDCASNMCNSSLKKCVGLSNSSSALSLNAVNMIAMLLLSLFAMMFMYMN